MDWITTSGSSIHEAKSNALDQLGIVADEAEFDIVNDVEKGLFGRVKTAAKVRTRVKPRQPQGRDDRRSRGGGASSNNRSKNEKSKNGKGKGGGSNRGAASRSGNDKSNDGDSATRGGAKQAKKTTGGRSETGGESGNRRRSGGQGSNRSDNRPEAKRGGKSSNGSKSEKSQDKTSKSSGAKQQQTKKRENVDHDFSRQDQQDVAVEFLEGLLEAFEMDGSVAVAEEPAEDDAIEVAVTGSELGLLVGQKGVTLNAVQELTRTVVQREADGARTERLRVDVAGYRERRKAALQDFARKIADDVVETGEEKVMEPMGPADRKVVHDALNDVDGVETGSEGEEPRRRVVIRPT